MVIGWVEQCDLWREFGHEDERCVFSRYQPGDCCWRIRLEMVFVGAELPAQLKHITQRRKRK